MNLATQILSAVVLLTLLLILLVLVRPRLIHRWEGRALVFFAFFILPLLATYGSAQSHMKGAQATSFCLSCHEMEPYGRSLKIDGEHYLKTDQIGYLPALHEQNNWVEREQSCFTCHSDYTLFGGMDAKLRGLQHVWVHYLGSPPKEIELYKPYPNTRCLRCHGQTRRFEAISDHQEQRADMDSGELSCLECHEYVHAVKELGELRLWNGGGR